MSNLHAKQQLPIAGKRKYRAFLLRCWQDEPDVPGGEAVWRFTIVHYDGKQTKRVFTQLEELLAYLQAELKIQKEGRI